MKAGGVEHHHPSQASAATVLTPASVLTSATTQSETTSTVDTIARLKKSVTESTAKDFYDVSRFYHKTGFSQWIVKHPRFEQLTLFVIALNAIWIWVDTDLNPGSMLITSPPLFQVVEHVFCAYFAYEWTLRFLAFQRKRDGLKDFWFIFDGLLVASMVFETWFMSAVFLFADNGSSGGGIGNASILRLARLLRLSRMARMARLLRALPELLILIKGMVAALRSVCFALGLLMLILYVFGIAFTQLCENTELEPDFKTVLISMHTLLIYGALMDEVSSLIIKIEENSIPLLLLFYVFLLLAALTVMNMLIGVICEMVLTVGEREREASTKAFVAEKITELVNSAGADANNDDLISKTEFIEMLENRKAVSILHEVGVDVVGLVDFADTIFEPSDGDMGERQLTFDEFMAVVLDLRGCKTARVKDLVDLRKHINYRFQRVESRLMDIDCMLRYQGAKNCLQDTSFLGRTTAAIEAQVSAWRGDVQAAETKSGRQSDPSGVTTEATFQDIIKGSLRDLQSSHERELAVLHAENFRLRDKLADLGKAAGKSLADVLEVAATVPTASMSTYQLPAVSSQLPTVLSSTCADPTASMGMDATATAEPQPTPTPRAHVQPALRDVAMASLISQERSTSARSASSTPAQQDDRATAHLYTSAVR